VISTSSRGNSNEEKSSPSLEGGLIKRQHPQQPKFELHKCTVNR
jgi:hypothetical protein